MERAADRRHADGVAVPCKEDPMHRSSPTPPPQPDRRPGVPEPLVDALGAEATGRPGDPARPAAEESGHHRGSRRSNRLRGAGIAAALLLVLVVVVLIL
jgi:hypothetical protein